MGSYLEGQNRAEALAVSMHKHWKVGLPAKFRRLASVGESCCLYSVTGMLTHTSLDIGLSAALGPGLHNRELKVIICFY
jgi:hypothetical protein